MTEYIVRMPSDMPYEIKTELNAWYVNSESIVRCRDCRYARKTDAGMDCDRHILCARFKPDGFCKWGERR